jgi:hypothetical protein
VRLTSSLAIFSVRNIEHPICLHQQLRWAKNPKSSSLQRSNYLLDSHLLLLSFLLLAVSSAESATQNTMTTTMATMAFGQADLRAWFSLHWSSSQRWLRGRSQSGDKEHLLALLKQPAWRLLFTADSVEKTSTPCIAHHAGLRHERSLFFG